MSVLLTAASPRPWYFDGWDVFHTGPTDDTGGHRLVFPLPHATFHPSQAINKADAELAVRAVNEYETLLAIEEAAREIIQAIDDDPREIRILEGTPTAHLIAALAALDAVRGTS